jgi:hypothetical protein
MVTKWRGLPGALVERGACQYFPPGVATKTVRLAVALGAS